MQKFLLAMAALSVVATPPRSELVADDWAPPAPRPPEPKLSLKERRKAATKARVEANHRRDRNARRRNRTKGRKP